jgi:DUF1680 family protein
MLIASGSTFLRPAFPEASGSELSSPALHPIAPVFSWLRLGEIRPAGWIREQMAGDLREGFASRLGDLCAEASSDIFTSHRIGMGSAADSSGYQRHWWNGETEGNWRAGYIMLSYLTGDEAGMRECDRYVQKILASQGKDGYLGAFDETSRFVHRGELWTQACLLRGLLDYSELTGDKNAQDAVVRAANLIVSVYQSGDPSKPWADGRDLGPEAHDLMISDVMERLFERTGDARYRDFTVWLYEGWSRKVVKADATKYDSQDTFDSTDVDTSLSSLLNRDFPFRQHGVHVFESIRMPLWLAMATGRDDFGQAYRNAFEKMGHYTEVSGAAVSMEQIFDRKPDPTLTEYEYCVIKEIQFTLESGLQKTGVAALGDHIERVWFNAAQGARLPNGKAVSYLTNDNRARCDGMDVVEAKVNKRNKFSPTHADEAVCCNPNATQVAPLYVRGMWMRHVASGGLAAQLYGPCTVKTQVRNVAVEIEQTTEYPFWHTVRIELRPEKEIEFPLFLRDPNWSRATTVTCAGASISRSGGFWTVTKKWKRGDSVELTFVPEVQEVPAVNGEVALQYGPLLFAKRIEDKKVTVKTYAVAGFEDAHYLPVAEVQEELMLPADQRWRGYGFSAQRKTTGANALRPFDAPLITLEGRMIRSADGRDVPVVLVPLGNAPILRRLTFRIGGSLPASASLTSGDSHD